MHSQKEHTQRVLLAGLTEKTGLGPRRSDNCRARLDFFHVRVVWNTNGDANPEEHEYL
jgi:hypothetical protein